MEAKPEAVRNFIERTNKRPNGPNPKSHSKLSGIQGKYAFVRTSVDQFLKRKHDDLELESQK